MAIDAGEVDGVVGGGIGKVVPVRKFFAGPAGLVPAAAADPFAWLRFSGGIAHLLQYVFDGTGLAQVKNLQPLAETGEVNVRVNQAGDNGGALCIDDLRGGSGMLLEVVAHREDAAILDGNGGGGGLRRVDGVDARAADNKVSGLGRSQTEQESEQAGEAKQHTGHYRGFRRMPQASGRRKGVAPQPVRTWSAIDWLTGRCMNRTFFLTFPAVAMSLGWAFRGFIGGGPLGAMIPGTMVALALLWLLERGDPPLRWPNAGLVAAFGAVGIGYGGQMTYGQTVGLASDSATMPWGLLGLALKGALWGLLGGATVGLAFTIGRYSRGRMLTALLAMLAGTWAGWWFVNAPKLIYFSNRLDRPREEVWMGLALGALAMLVVLLWKTPNAALVRFAWASFVGGGLGFGLGGALLAVGRNSGLDNSFWPWWKGMEYTFGLLFGLALGWAAWQSRDEIREMAAVRPQDSPAGLRGVSLLVAAALLVAGGVWFEYTVDLRFAYSVAGSVLLAVALYSESLAWHIALTMTCFAFFLDLAEAFSGELAFGTMALGIGIAVAASLAVWAAVERIRAKGGGVLQRMFWLVTLAAFVVTSLKTGMQIWRAPGPHVEYWTFVAAMVLVWRLYRRGERLRAAGGI